MANIIGITKQGLDLAMSLKDSYASGRPIPVLEKEDKLLMPEHLLNQNIDLQIFEDPLPLAMVASRDPDSPMSVAAAVRMCGNAAETPLVKEVFRMLTETSKHPVVKECVKLIATSSFNPRVVGRVHNNAKEFVALSRKRYTKALKNNLKYLLDGELEARTFVTEFFELSEAGNLRIDIRKKLILGLLVSERIRPAIKFLFLENLERLPVGVRREIINAVINSPDKRCLEAIKQELTWLKLELLPGQIH